MNEHKEAYYETGFWGRSAAGAIVVARDTGRFLIALRAEGTLQPGTWGTWGGAVDAGETPEQTVIRELHEEAAYDQKPQEIVPLYIFEHESGFKYRNFLVVVEREFTPVLNWEMEQFDWFDYECWPDPLHFGLEQLFAHDPSREILKKFCS